MKHTKTDDVVIPCAAVYHILHPSGVLHPPDKPFQGQSRTKKGHREEATKQGEEGLVGTQNQARGTHKPPQRGGEVGGTTGRDLQGHRK